MTRRAKSLGAVLGALAAGASAWGCGGNTASLELDGHCDGGALCGTNVSPGCVGDASCVSSGACAGGGCADGASNDGASAATIDSAPPECDGGPCAACIAGSACTPANSCHQGAIVCNNGISFCLDRSVNVARGTACGSGNVCDDGVCVGQCDGSACTMACPGPGCDSGTTCPGPGCDSGTTCTEPGCDAGMTCASAGMSCPLPGTCYYGVIQCIAGHALCNTGMPLPNGSSCDSPGSICINGNCSTQLYVTAMPALASTTLTVSGALFNVTDILPSDSPSALTAVLDWGDGTTSDGTVAGSAGTFTVSGSHLYTGLGGYTVTLTLSDPATGGSASGTTTVSVGFTVFPVANVGSSITAGPDGNLWFTMPYTNQIGRMTPAGVVTPFAIPTPSAGPSVIAPGPDGNLWFTENASNKIASITPLGVFTEYDISTLGSQPAGIAAGADGNLWYTEGLGDKIGRISPTGTNAAEFSIPIAAAGPGAIVAGPDGNMWFTLANVGGNTGAVGTITPAGVIEVIMLPTEYGPYDLTVGPDGNVWYANIGTTSLGRITPSGTVTEVEIGMRSTAIAVGSDGNLWFVGGNYGGDTRDFGKVTPAGVTTEYTLPLDTGGLTTGPDGNLWMATDDAIVMVVP
jgi:virginiamycin B lyase